MYVMWGLKMVNLNELKGIDFSTKYYDPKKFKIKNEFYEFYSELDFGWGRLNCKFKSKYYNTETNVSASSMFSTLRESINWMNYNKHCINKLRDLFLDYDDINFIELFFDLTVNIQNELTHLRIHENEGRERYHPFYKSVLEGYGINCNDINLNELNYLNPISPRVTHQYTLDELLSEDIEDSKNIYFRLAYIFYLQEVNSSHNNVFDEKNYYDITPNYDSNFHGFPLEIIKKIALSKNHIIDGKGVGILRYKTKLADLKSVAKKYDLKQTGSKKVLIKRIEDNLSVDVINREFSGSRFILTEDGKKFLNKFTNYNRFYFQSLPECFNSTELDILCRENPQYSIEEIIYSLVKEDWCKLENHEYYYESDFHSIIFSIHQKRYLLAKQFEKDFPKKAIELYESCLLEQFNPSYFDKLTKLYKKYHLADKNQELLSTMIKNTTRKIEIAKSNIDKVVMEIIEKTLNLLDNVIEMNEDKDILKILMRIKKNFDLNSIDDVKFHNCLIESYDKLEIMNPNGMEKLREAYHLIKGAEIRIHHGVKDLELELNFLESYSV